MKFIAIEGCDCSGKTTHVELLKKAHPEFVFTKAPGGSDIGRKLREYLLSGDGSRLPIEAEAFLFCADRALQVREVIIPALTDKRVVISDRYVYSSLVYQYIPETKDGWRIRDAIVSSCLGVYPTLTLYLDVEPSEAIRRMKEKTDINRLDAKDIETAKDRRDAYFREFVNYSEHNVLILDTTHLSVDETQKKIQDVILAHIRD